MKQRIGLWSYFSGFEKSLWMGSVLLIVSSFLLFDRESGLTPIASVIGITSLIFCAKGNPIGQLLMILFSLLYGIISYGFAYYGEMVTYMGMSLPMAVFSLVSWLRNPYGENHAEVRVNRIGRREIPFLALLTVVVTVVLYFVLKWLGTANLTVSTVSVTTSFLAAYLTFRRSPYYALAYALNDIVLIVLWIPVCMRETRYISVVVCFLAFLANDLYGFFSWRGMERRQRMNTSNGTASE